MHSMALHARPFGPCQESHACTTLQEASTWQALLVEVNPKVVAEADGVVVMQDPEGMWPEDAEFWETCLLVGLFGCLWLVIWRRMSLRSARRRAAAAPGPPPGSPPTQTAPASQPHGSGATGPVPHAENEGLRDTSAQTFAGNRASDAPAQAGGSGSATSTPDEELETVDEMGGGEVAEGPAAATIEEVMLETGSEDVPEEARGVDAGMTAQQLRLLEGELTQLADSAEEQAQAASWDDLREGLGSSQLSGRVDRTAYRMPQQISREALEPTASRIEHGSCSRAQQFWQKINSADSSAYTCHKTSAELMGQEERAFKDAELCVRSEGGAGLGNCLQGVWQTPTLLTGSWEKHRAIAYSLPLVHCGA